MLHVSPVLGASLLARLRSTGEVGVVKTAGIVGQPQFKAIPAVPVMGEAIPSAVREQSPVPANNSYKNGPATAIAKSNDTRDAPSGSVMIVVMLILSSTGSN